MSEKKATRVAYGEALVELAKKNDKIVVLDADLAQATQTCIFQKAFPERHFDLGIAEANMVDVANGMSCMGLIPFCSTFAVFAGRNFEQIRNGVCYPHNNVKFAFTHAGVTVGEDGGTHQAIEDIALMRVLPGMTVIVPCDANETYKAVEAAAAIDGPVYLRLARLATTVFDPMPFEVGKGNVMRDGKDAVIFACGLMVEQSLMAADTAQGTGQGCGGREPAHHQAAGSGAGGPLRSEVQERLYGGRTQRHRRSGRRGGRRAGGQRRIYLHQDRRGGSVRPERQGHGRAAGLRPVCGSDRRSYRCEDLIFPKRKKPGGSKRGFPVFGLRQIKAPRSTSASGAKKRRYPCERE